MLRTTAIAKELAAIERKMQETQNATLKEALKKKQARLKAELKDPGQSATKLAKTLLAQREVVKQLSKVEFNDLIRRLSKKPEYSFLKTMPKSTVKNDLEVTAKPVGWRFKGRGNYDKPTKVEIAKGKKNGTVYREVRPRRSDVSQVVRLKDGGGVDSIEPTGYKQNDAVKYGKKLIDAGVKYSIVRSKIEEHYAGLRGEIQDVMNKVLDYKESKMKQGGSMYADGGGVDKVYLVGKPQVDVVGRFNKKRYFYKTATIKSDGTISYGQVTFNWQGSAPKGETQWGTIISTKDFQELTKKYDKGGSLEEESVEMINNQATSAKHHIEELKKVLSHQKHIEPWVIAKMQRATTDLSDITHYLDGKDPKMAFGGIVYDLSNDAVDRMEGLTPIDSMEILNNNVLEIYNSLEEEGFEKDEIASFLSYKIVQYLNKMALGGKIGSTLVFKNFQGDIKEGEIIDFVGNRGYEVRSGYGTAFVTPSEVITVKDQMMTGGGVDKVTEQFPEVVLEIYANNEYYRKANFTEKALIDVKNQKIKFTQLDTGSGNFRIAWKKVYENSNGYYIDYDYFGGRIFIENWYSLCQEYKPERKMATGGMTEHGLDRGDTIVFNSGDEVMVVDKKDEQHLVDLDKGIRYEGGGNIEIGDKVKASKEYGGKSGTVIEKRGSFVVVQDSKGKTESYHESDLVKKMAKGGEVSFTDYKGESIMFEPHFNEYYVGDAGPFSTMDEAKEYIDGGSQMPDSIKEAYRKGLFARGGQLTTAQQKKFDKVMHEWSQGKLHSGSEDGPIVKDQDQAVAIAYAEARGMNKMAKGGYIEGREEFEGFKYQIYYSPTKGMYSVSDNEGVFKGDNNYFKKYDQAKEHAEISISSMLSDKEEMAKGGGVDKYDALVEEQRKLIDQLDNTSPSDRMYDYLRKKIQSLDKRIEKMESSMMATGGGIGEADNKITVRKDKINPNFLFVEISYYSAGGFLVGMNAQLREEGSKRAMKIALDIEKKIKQSFNIEDSEAVDLNNGLVQLFLVSDDFINIDPKKDTKLNAIMNDVNKKLQSSMYAGGGEIKSLEKQADDIQDRIDLLIEDGIDKNEDELIQLGEDKQAIYRKINELKGKKYAEGGLTGDQRKLDVNKNGKIDSEDLSMLRSGKGWKHKMK